MRTLDTQINNRKIKLNLLSFLTAKHNKQIANIPYESEMLSVCEILIHVLLAQIVILTTSGAASDKIVVEMTFSRARHFMI